MQQQLRPAFRFIAAGCVLLWLSATSYCSLEHLLDGDQHSHGHSDEGAVAAPAGNGAEQTIGENGDADDSHEQDESGHGSQHHDEDGSCCSALHATALTPAQALGRPVFHTGTFLCTIFGARDLASLVPEKHFYRQPKERDWVFTPEVSLGPAFHSLPPPSQA